MHRYNNSDHSMLTAMVVVSNIVGDAPREDPWEVNVEQDYHEEIARPDAAADAAAPSPVAQWPARPRTAAAGSGRAAPVIPTTARPVVRRPSVRDGAA
ncbi:hypothetical protein GCM10011594_01410 [Nakamurella endophytica]|uniref:Uncharacterized protein n=1 Tax=Nakamurella endophytica TaxID=1748367 RepID=A0A917SK92_9ACTN|nr:hypothetical protein GCM10011594_01410 [Nakamurella endophytica]